MTASGARGRRALVQVVVGVACLGVGGVVAMAFVKSPFEAAAETEPPDPTVLSAVVEERVLADTVVVRGTVTTTAGFELSPRVSADGVPVVTSIRVSVGEEVAAGDVIGEVSGRPIIVLPGEVPAFRDMRPGAEGADVAQLQVALDGLGFSTEVDGKGSFGPGTRDAVEQLYESLGYEPATTGDEDLVKSADTAVAAAERVLDDLRRELQLAKESRSAAVDAAKDADEVATTLEDGAKAADRAADEAESAARSNPADPELVADAAELRAAAEEASTTAAEARAEADALKVAAVLSPGTEDPVAAATRAVERAEEDLASARQERADVVAKTGQMMPLGEYAFLPVLPARVQSLDAFVGDELTGPMMSLSSGELVVEAHVDVGLRGLLAEGMDAGVLSELTGFEASGLIEEIGEATENEERGFGHSVIVRPDSPLPPESEGADVRVTVEAAATEGPVLVVPVAAVTSAADGTTIVVRLDGTNQTRVPVVAGLSGDGYVQIEPTDPESLGPGDRVVTGS